jgi:ABC-2 type transport system permease protein/sodium transport system permease protein
VTPAYYAAAVLLGVSLWPLILLLIIALMGGLNANLERYEEFLGILSEARQTPLAVMVVFVVVPAIVEELFFRGYLFSALRAVSGPVATIAVTAILFGLFHVITEPFGFGRFWPSTLMGLILSWVCWQTRSVIPGMILHGLHNGILVVVGQGSVPTAWRAAAGGAAAASLPAEDPGLPLAWILAGAAGTVIGAALLLLAGRRTPAEPTAPAESPLEPSAATS